MTTLADVHITSPLAVAFPHDLAARPADGFVGLRLVRRILVLWLIFASQCAFAQMVATQPEARSFKLGSFDISVLRDGALVAVLDDWQLPLNYLSALYPASRQPSPKVRALIDFLVAEYQPIPPWDA